MQASEIAETTLKKLLSKLPLQSHPHIISQTCVLLRNTSLFSDINPTSQVVSGWIAKMNTMLRSSEKSDQIQGCQFILASVTSHPATFMSGFSSWIAGLLVLLQVFPDLVNTPKAQHKVTVEMGFRPRPSRNEKR
jgi:hypothetical protein